MIFIRNVPGADGMPRLAAYQCKPCGIVFSECSEADDRNGAPRALEPAP
jgi:hypothetical protein